MRFAEHLKAIANPNYEFSAFGMGDHGVHDGRKAGDGACPQIVAVRKATWENDAVETLERSLLVPDVFDGLIEYVLYSVVSVLVAVRASEADHREFHGSIS